MQQQPNNNFSPQTANNTIHQQFNQVFQQSNISQSSNTCNKQYSDEDLFIPCQYINPYSQQLNSNSSQNQLQSNLDIVHYSTDNSQQMQQSISNCSLNDNLCYFQPQVSHFKSQPQNSNYLQPQILNYEQNYQASIFEQQTQNIDFLSSSQSSSYEQSQNSIYEQQSKNESFEQTFQNSNVLQQPQYSKFIDQSQNSISEQQSQNESFEQTFQNSNLLQQPQYSKFIDQSQNSISEQQSQNESFEQTFQNSNVLQQPQYSKFEQKSQNINIEQNQPCLDNLPKAQTFHILYNSTEFIVNPICLCKTSLLFNKLIQPYIKDFNQMKSLHLEIYGDKFSNRNMNNFLLLCQNQPTDIQDNEMKEICDIAKMFKAEDIYYTGLDFIRRSIDHSFYVPDNKYDGSDGITYLKLVNENAKTGEKTTTIDDINKTDYKINEEVKNEENKPSQKILTNADEESPNPVIYSLFIESQPFMKRPLIRFKYNYETLFTAKRKYNEVFIAKGIDVHISKKEDHVAYIKQNEAEKSNTISMNGMNFKVNYIHAPGTFWIDASFPFKNGIEHLSPMKPKYNMKTKKIYFDLSGAYNHDGIESNKNVVLKNDDGNVAFILRKVFKHSFEVECNKDLDPLIAFTIAISEIFGPYKINPDQYDSVKPFNDTKNNSYMN